MKQLFLLFTAILLIGASCQRTPSGGWVGGQGDVFPQPKVGSAAEFQYYPRWNVSGKVSVVDERTLRFDDFTFRGGELRAELRLQRNRIKVAVLKDITRETNDQAGFDITLPAGVSVQDFNVVTVYSPDLGTPVSGAEFRL